MSSEGLIVSNPRGNNRDYDITFVGRDGATKKYKTLRPGEACRVDKRAVTIVSVPRPPRLLLTDHGLVPDVGGRRGF